MWRIRELDDKGEILGWLQADRLYAAYAIGDLEPALFAQSRFVGAQAPDKSRALALHFRGLKMPVLFLMGHPEGLRALLKEAQLPERAYLTCRAEHISMVHDLYTWEKAIPMWRMVVEPERFRPVKGRCIRLAAEHSSKIKALFALGEGFAFHPAQLEQGVFYGILIQDQLAAIAGTHVVSPTYGLAAVGNVITAPGQRGKGYGTSATGAVVDDLFRRGIRQVVLNVAQGNAPAIHVYQKLGFERYCPFFEGWVDAQDRLTAQHQG
jgi:RimJ/RimL family protein N-acetyltransferase